MHASMLHGGARCNAIAVAFVTLTDVTRHPSALLSSYCRPQRDGMNVHSSLEMRLAEALLGRSVSVPTIDGMAQLTVPSFTQNGDVLRMRGKGVADPRGRGRGDQLVHVR